MSPNLGLARTVRSAVMRRMADPARRNAARVAAERKRRQAGRPHEVFYFHQVDDPYSQLAAQALRPFLERFDVALRPRVVEKPTPIAIHEKKLWDAWALRDCAVIAPYYGLAAPAQDPDPALADLARGILLNLESSPLFAEVSLAVGDALRGKDEVLLKGLARKHGIVPPNAARAQLQRNFALRHRLGHYLGAMFFYEREWYWGIDRLHYLETRLDALGARKPNAPAGNSVPFTRRAPENLVSAERVTLEYFPSLRSPYTHLSYARVADLCKRYPVDLIIRPVLPMMMRGVKADRRKGQYILFDTQREAERLGVAFGSIWDPFGNPVRRAYSLFAFAQAHGKGFEYLHTYSTAVWSERVNAWDETGLKAIVERAGLSWGEAQKMLDNKDWEPVMERNVQDMIAAGSWGVPTFRLPAMKQEPEFTVWGQDRIWLIEEEIARRLARPAG